MSQNTYYLNATIPGVVKTTDANQRRRLTRRGWYKVRRDQLLNSYRLATIRDLAAQSDGRYVYDPTTQRLVLAEANPA